MGKRLLAGGRGRLLALAASVTLAAGMVYVQNTAPKCCAEVPAAAPSTSQQPAPVAAQAELVAASAPVVARDFQFSLPKGPAPEGGLQVKTIWVARPAPADGSGCAQTLPVNWRAIVDAADTSTNWQVLPGDRVFVAEDKLVALDNFVDKVIGPFERIVGFNLLTFQAIQTANRFPLGFQTGAGAAIAGSQ